MSMRKAFTVIELLVTIGIIVILCSISFMSYFKILESSKKTREINAAKVLIAGYHTYAADNGGRLLKVMDPNPGVILDKKGIPIMSHAGKRWPWRLAPYIEYNTDILMVNNKEAAPEDSSMYSYLVTVFPTLGINGTFVGGKYGTIAAPDYPRSNRGNFCVTTIVQPADPTKLIVFISAKMDGAPHSGCYDVGMPGFGALGEVEYKYDGEAVVAYFDGHVELNSIDDLKDMRRWSNQAAIQNDPNWSW